MSPPSRTLKLGEEGQEIVCSLLAQLGMSVFCQENVSLLARLPLRESRFVYSWNAAFLGEKCGFCFIAQSNVTWIFLDRKWRAPVAIPASRVEAGRMEVPECARNNTARLSCEGGHLSCSPHAALEPHCDLWQPPAFSLLICKMGACNECFLHLQGLLQSSKMEDAREV